MKILRLRLSDFRLFEEAEFEFGPGMNVVRGPNESGKSSLASAIVACLFERPNANNVDTRSARRWGSDRGPRMEMELAAGGERYRLVKDFSDRSVLLERLDGALRLDTARAVEHWVLEKTGFGDSDRFRRTACVTHDQMTSLVSDGAGDRKLARMLREAVVGDAESDLVEASIKELSAGVDDLKRGLERPSGNPGLIKRLQEERRGLEARLGRIREALDRLEAQRSRLESVHVELAECEERLRDVESLLDKNERLRACEEQLAGALSRFERAEAYREARAGLDNLQEQIDRRYRCFEGLDPRAFAELRKNVEVGRSLKEQLHLIDGKLAAAGRSGGTGRWRRVAAPALIGLTLVVLGLALGFRWPFLFIVIAAGALLFVLGVFSRRSAKRFASAEVAGVLESHRGSIVDELRLLEERERGLVAAAGFPDVDAFTAAFQAYQDLLAERDIISAGLGVLTSDGTLNPSEDERRDASLAVVSLKEEVRKLEPFRLDPPGLLSFSRERESLSGRVEGLRKEKEGLEYHLARAAPDIEDATALQESCSWTAEREENARRRLRIYCIALEAMQQVRNELVSSAVPALAEGVGRALSSLTGGRYDTVLVRDEDLAISVYSKEKGGFISAEELLSGLSRGTVSQLYLAVRLELADLLSGGRKPPLVFDDSFSYFDEDRFRRLWEMLLGASRERQVFVLTCTSRYDELVGEGVDLIELGRCP